MKTDLNDRDRDGDDDNPWHKQRPLQVQSPQRSFSVVTSSSFKMRGNSIWKTLEVVLRLYVSTYPGEDEFQVRCLRVAPWNCLNLWEIFGLSIAICSAQFTFLQSVLHKNRKTIISHTIICHSISVFLAHVWKIAPQSAEENPRKFDLLTIE